MTPGWLTAAVDDVTAHADAPDLADYLNAITAAARRDNRATVAVGDLALLAADLTGPPWPAAPTTAPPCAPAGGHRDQEAA